MEGETEKGGCFFMIDFEARGPSMRLHGVNAVGIVAFSKSGEEVGAYGSGIAAAEGQTFDEDTQKFWDKNPEALEWTVKNAKPAEQVAGEIVAFHADMQARFGEVVWLGWPAAYDWSRLVAFLDAHLPGGTPAAIGFKAECVSSMANALRISAGMDKKPSPESLGFENPAAHNPVADARVQGFAFFEVVRRLGLVRDQKN